MKNELSAVVGCMPDDRAIRTPEQRSRVDALGRVIAGRLALCSEDELRVIDQLLGRLELGRQRYGYLDLSADSRDWRAEEAEEHLDAAVYRACDRIRRRDEQLERLRCEVADENAAAHPVAHGLRELAASSPWIHDRFCDVWSGEACSHEPGCMEKP
jgi:hypothetical protein